MRKRHSQWLWCAVVAACLITPRDVFALELKGYYKNLLTFSETGPGDDYYSDMNRLRLEMDSNITRTLSAKVIYDNELIFGSFLNTPEFALLKAQPQDTYFDLDKVLADTGDVYWRHSLYRCYLAYTGEKTTLTAGRQRVALGVGKIWNPKDLINPVSPLSLERDERTGADAIHADFHLGALSGLGLVYAKKDAAENAVIKAKTNLKGYDLSAMAGRFGEDAVLGLDFSGYIGDSGFRGEGTYTFADQRDDFVRGVLSWDYTFENTLYVLLEYLYNGGNIDGMASPYQFTGEIITKNRNFLGIGMGYDLTPLVRLDALSILDLDGESIFLGPSIKYNIVQNVDWITGAQFFRGRQDGEYGSMPDVYYTQAQWYF